MAHKSKPRRGGSRKVISKLCTIGVSSALIGFGLWCYVARTICGVLQGIVSLVLPFLKPAPVERTPEQAFQEAKIEELGYTFAPNYFDMTIQNVPVRVHFVDEGPRNAKHTILCLHGEPSWSFLYRHMVKPLVAEGHRVVVPDFIGFGKSDKPTQARWYSHDLHKSTVSILVSMLSLENVTLVVQDWGGLTGLSVLPTIDAAVSRVVIMNTGLPSAVIPKPYVLCEPDSDVKNKQTSLIERVFSPLTNKLNWFVFIAWRTTVLGLGCMLPVSKVFQTSLRRKSNAIVKAYGAPYHNLASKMGASLWPLWVPLTKSFPVAADLQRAADFLNSSTYNKPTLIMFSDRDPITRGADKWFLQCIDPKLTGGRNVTVRGAGHFLQEDAGEVLASNINTFLAHGIQHTVEHCSQEQDSKEN